MTAALTEPQWRAAAEERSAALTAEQRRALAEYLVLERYDIMRSGRFGDMAGSRRGMMVDRRATKLIESGVHYGRIGPGDGGDAWGFPAVEQADIAEAFERVGRPRLARVIREGERYDTRYRRVSIETWREVEAWACGAVA